MQWMINREKTFTPAGNMILRMGEGLMAKHSVRNGGAILQKVWDLERNLR